MAVTVASSLIDRALVVLQDDGTRWSRAELLDWLNDGQVAVVNRRPDLSVKNGPFTCVAGTKQTLPSDGLRLVKVTRNLTTKNAIRPLEFAVLDNQVPEWHDAKQTSAIKHYLYDGRDPKTFYLSPPAKVDTSIELCYTVAPTVLTLETDTIGVDDSYANALLDFMLARAYAKDSDFAANAQRAQAHLQLFAMALGDKLEPDGAMTPRPLPEGEPR